MNKVFISGLINEAPVFRKEQGDIPHLILSLCVRHKTSAGKMQKETYRVSAWHNAALWGAEHLKQGQIVGLQGYITQRKVNAGNIMATETEIAVDEFLSGPVLPERNEHEPVEPAAVEAAG